MNESSRMSRLPPAKEPSAEQLARVPDRVEGLSRLGSPPRIPPLGDKPKGQRPRILLVDDEETFIDHTRDVWKNTELSEYADFEFFLYTDERRTELIEILRSSFNDKRPYDTVYIDVNLGGSGSDAGIGLITRLRKEVNELHYIPFVAITSFPDSEKERQAREHGAIRFIIKTSEKSAADIIGSLVHRMIFEARETLEQVEDQLWADAAAKMAKELHSGDWKYACGKVLDFVHINFTVKALYARRIGNTDIDILEEIASKNNLWQIDKKLNISKIPFLHSFMNSDSYEPHRIIANLTAKHIGPRFANDIKDHHVVLARIGVGKETFGLLTMYRPPEERPFRGRDAGGLSRLASLLAAAIAQERLADERHREMDRLRDRQSSLLAWIRRFDNGNDETAIWVHLRDALFDAFKSSVDGGEMNLKITVRKITPGTNLAERPCPPAGLMSATNAGPLSLEDTERSSVARAIWTGESQLFPDLDHPRDRHTFMFRNPGTRSALTVPAMDQGICVGAVNLECLAPNAFSEADRVFVEVLAATAAAAIIRLRARRFLEGMTDIAAMLAQSDPPHQSDPPETRALIKRTLSLLFDFTGCSEILYAVPQGGDQFNKPWALQSLFQRNKKGEIVELAGDDAVAWQNQVTTGWRRSLVCKVLSSGKNVDWAGGWSEIELTDEGLPGRKSDQKTRTQAVIVVRSGTTGGPEAAISLLIQQRNAMSDVRLSLLERCGMFLANLLLHQKELSRILGLATIREQEARLGQVLSQVRHGLRGKLALIRQHLLLVEGGYDGWTDAANSIKHVLTELEREFDRNRWLIKIPRIEMVDLGIVWSSLYEELTAVAQESGGRIEANQLQDVKVPTDPDIIRTILFNLVDNALRYGGAGTTVFAKIRKTSNNVFIEIHDTGRGIADSVRHRLFAPMATTTSDSTGLGLYLSRLRAVDLGGDLILINSTPAGSSFEVNLPNA